MLDHGEEAAAYAAYLFASQGRPFDDPDEQQAFDQDLIKARAQMERAWLENKPTQGDAP
jgi:dienelactone hydrolase